MIDEEQRCYIVKVANLSDSVQPIEIAINGLKRKVSLGVTAEQTLLICDDPMAENTLDNPTRIVPVKSLCPMTGTTLSTDIAPRSFAVYRIPLAD